MAESTDETAPDRVRKGRERAAFREAIEQSSFGTPAARALRLEGHRLASGQDSLTGVPEEQADWEGEQ